MKTFSCAFATPPSTDTLPCFQMRMCSSHCYRVRNPQTSVAPNNYSHNFTWQSEAEDKPWWLSAEHRSPENCTACLPLPQDCWKFPPLLQNRIRSQLKALVPHGRVARSVCQEKLLVPGQVMEEETNSPNERGKLCVLTCCCSLPAWFVLQRDARPEVREENTFLDRKGSCCRQEVYFWN